MVHETAHITFSSDMNENVEINPSHRHEAADSAMDDAINIEPWIGSIEVVPRRAPVAIQGAHQDRFIGSIEESKEVVVEVSPEEVERQRLATEWWREFYRDRVRRYPPELVALFARPDAWRDSRLVIDFSEDPGNSYICGYGYFRLLPRAPEAPEVNEP